MKDLFIHDELILNQKVKKVFAFFCFLGILGTLSILIPAIQKYFLLFVEKKVITIHPVIKELMGSHPDSLSNWVPIFIISSLTCFFIVFILAVIKKTINKYEFFIFMFFIILLLCVFPVNGVNSYVESSYLLSYRYGFAHRMLIGTIVDMLSYGGYVSRLLILCFIFCSTVWLSFLVSTITGYLIMKSDDKIPVLLLTLLYLSSSVSIQAYFYFSNFGRIEIYVLIFMLAALSIINKKVLRWFIPALCFMSLAAHLVIVFFYIPFIFIILLYVYFNKPNQSKNEMKLLIITVLSVIVTFIYFVIFSKSTLIYQDWIIFTDILKEKTNAVNPGLSLEADFFSIIDTFRYAIRAYKNSMVYRIYCIIQSLPLFIFFILFWRTCIKKEQKKAMKFIFHLSMFLPVFSIPAFVFFIDWGRWVVMLLTIQFMLVFYFLYKQENAVTFAMKKFIVIFKKNCFIFFIYIMLSIFFGPIWASPNFTHLMNIFIRIIREIL